MMDISRKTDYALRMLAALVRDPAGVVSVRTAAQDNGVPYSFARSIQHDLAGAGIIESLRGSKGGMRLLVDPATVTLLEVVEAVQGPISLASCAYAGPDGGACPRASECCFNPIWKGARELLDSYLSSVSLAEVVAGEARPRVSERFVERGGSGIEHELGEKGAATAPRALVAAAAAPVPAETTVSPADVGPMTPALGETCAAAACGGCCA